jgi:alpha-L-arabinofuranosidase
MCKEKNNVGFHNFSEYCRQIDGRINAKLITNVGKEGKKIFIDNIVAARGVFFSFFLSEYQPVREKNNVW